MKPFSYLTVAAILLFLTGCASPKDDLKMMCDEAQKAEAGQANYADANDPGLEHARTVTPKIKSDAVLKAWEGLDRYGPTERYDAFQSRIADNAGIEGWECPALEKLLEPAPSEE